MAHKINYQIVNLRVFAILSVVLGHSCIIYDGHWDTYPAAYDSSFFMWLKTIITAYQMQVFFAISGFLFYNTIKKYSYLELVKNKGKRLLIPFFFVGLCWLIPVRLIAHYPNYAGSYLLGLKQFMYSDWGHLWFLPVLFVFFICLYHPFQCKSRISIAKDITIMLICFLAGLCSKFFPFYTLFKLSLNWVFWFVLGFFMSKYGFQLPNRKAPLSIIILLSTILLLPFVALRLEGLWGRVIGFIASLFIVLSSFLYMHNWSLTLVKYLDKNSMGIYLFHSPIIYVLYDRFAMHLHPVEMVSLNFVVSVVASVGITVLLRTFGLKVLIGE